MRSIVAVAAALAVAAGIAACAPPPPPPLTLVGPFDPSEVKWSEKPGRNTVSGFAVLRTAGGQARTCAGLKAYLIPDSEYAREHMRKLFDALDEGTRSVENAPTFEPTEAQYVAAMRTTRCDGQGYFSFEHVPDGAWYVATSVVWFVSPMVPPQGSYMMQRVQVRRGQTVKLALPAT